MTKVNQLEYKILQMLKDDSRKSASDIAKELNVSRATVAKIIKSLKEKGVKFTVDYYEDGELTAFIISERCESEECYKLIDGKYMSVFNGDLKKIHEVLSRTKSEKYYIAIERMNMEKIERAELYCDYCGNEIKGNPFTVKIGKKVYYTCCKTCQSQLRRKLGEKNI